MATWQEIGQEPGNIFRRFLEWRNRNIANTEAGYLLTRPNVIAPASFNEAIYTDANLRDELIRTIRRYRVEDNELRRLARNANGRNALNNGDLERKIIELIDPNNKNVPSELKNKLNARIEDIRRNWENAHGANARANSRWENGKRIPFSNFKYNTELAKQNWSKLGKGLKAGGYLGALLLANDLYNAKDKQGAFEDFIGWTSPREQMKERMMEQVSSPSVLGTNMGATLFKLKSPEEQEAYLKRFNNEKELSLTPYITNAGIGAGIGGLGGLITGTGVGTGAIAGAAGGVASLAALAGGYALGSYMDQKMGISDYWAKKAWDFFHGDDLAKADEAAANNSEVIKARAQIALKHDLRKKYNYLTAEQANNIASDYIDNGYYENNTPLSQSFKNVGVPFNIPIKANTVNAQPANVPSQTVNGITPQNVRVAPPGVNFMAYTPDPLPEREPESFMRGYTQDGRLVYDGNKIIL